MNAMAKITMVCGMLLLIEGIVCFLGWKQLGAAKASVTALIPAFVGVPLMLLGWLALAKPNLRMHLMHASVTLGLLGFLAAAGRVTMVLLKGGYFGVGATASVIMAIVCGVYVALSVRSFIAARRARETTTG